MVLAAGCVGARAAAAPSRRLASWTAGPVLVALALTGCGGSVESDGGSGGTGGAAGSGGSVGAGGSFTGGSGGTGSGSSGGTGGRPYVEPECPDVPPPDPIEECDPMNPLVGCDEGEGCYPYFDYPEGDPCAAPVFGAICAPASSGEQGEFCGDELGYCAPGYMCVVGGAGGSRCARICSLVGESGCSDGFICTETDVRGYGVCF